MGRRRPGTVRHCHRQRWPASGSLCALIKGVNGKLNPRPNLTIISLFRYFLVYINHQKRYHHILESSTQLKPFPRQISLQTSIVGEAQELLESGFYMDESSIFRGFELDKGMVILISSYLFL